MKRFCLLVFLAAGLLGLTGCGNTNVSAPAATNTPSAAAVDPRIPQQAQPKLPTMKLWIGPTSMTAELALTEPERQTGMMFRTNMDENDGMLFVFAQPFQASFWMKNTVLPLSAAYIDPNGVILEIHDLQSQDTTPVTASSPNVQYVLETRQGWFNRNGIQPGVSIGTEKGPLAKVFVVNQ